MHGIVMTLVFLSLCLLLRTKLFQTATYTAHSRGWNHSIRRQSFHFNMALLGINRRELCIIKKRRLIPFTLLTLLFLPFNLLYRNSNPLLTNLTLFLRQLFRSPSRRHSTLFALPLSRYSLHFTLEFACLFFRVFQVSACFQVFTLGLPVLVGSLGGNLGA